MLILKLFQIQGRDEGGLWQFLGLHRAHSCRALSQWPEVFVPIKLSAMDVDAWLQTYDWKSDSRKTISGSGEENWLSTYREALVTHICRWTRTELIII